MLLRKLRKLSKESCALLCVRVVGELLTAKCIDLSLLIDYSTYFKDVIQYQYCQFSPVSA